MQHVLIYDGPEPFGIEYQKVCSFLKEMECETVMPEQRAGTQLEIFLRSKVDAVIIILTKRLLTSPESKGKEIWDIADKYRIPVIPVRFSDELLEAFTNQFGIHHVLDLRQVPGDSMEQITKERFLRGVSSVIVRQEDIDSIADELSMQVFLSYRKKDGQYVQDMMRRIHQRPENRDVGIWYDNSLTPGREFNDEIKENLQKSQAMVLLVTDHLLEEGNYVREIEYPYAKKEKLPILPYGPYGDTFHEKAFFDSYPGLEDMVRVDCQGEEHQVPGIFQNIVPKEDTPEHLFRIGISYLLGLYAEQDMEKGLEMITRAADQGYPMAMSRLARLYLNGWYLGKDEEKGYYWLCRSMDYLLTVPEKLVIYNYEDELSKEEISAWFANDCRRLREISDDCRDILNLMQRMNRWEMVDKVVNVMYFLLLCQKGKLPLMSGYQKMIGYEKKRMPDGTYTVGKARFETSYRCTGNVQNNELEECCHILAKNKEQISQAVFEKLRIAWKVYENSFRVFELEAGNYVYYFPRVRPNLALSEKNFSILMECCINTRFALIKPKAQENGDQMSPKFKQIRVFDRNRCKEIDKAIRYMLGQLRVVHSEEKQCSFLELSYRYDGTSWTKDENKLRNLLFFISYVNGREVKATDPSFEVSGCEPTK